MMKAAGHNMRHAFLHETQGVTTAVLHGLDCAFNKGKGKFIDTYTDNLFPNQKKTRKVTAQGYEHAEDTLLSLMQPSKRNRP